MRLSYAVILMVLTACGLPAKTALPEAVEGDGANGSFAILPTDPATVVLSAGKPQLIEFFAFW